VLSATPEKYETYIGIMGSMHGDMNDMNPSRNVIKKRMLRPSH
jgi:hypothetical protein